LLLSRFLSPLRFRVLISRQSRDLSSSSLQLSASRLGAFTPFMADVLLAQRKILTFVICSPDEPLLYVAFRCWMKPILGFLLAGTSAKAFAGAALQDSRCCKLNFHI